MIAKTILISLCITVEAHLYETFELIQSFLFKCIYFSVQIFWVCSLFAFTTTKLAFYHFVYFFDIEI